MAKLKTMRPRLGLIDTRRVKPLTTDTRRLTGAALQNLRRLIYSRDGGRCRLCAGAVEFGEYELDHRIALQFGGTNDTANLWALCKACHAAKSARETAGQAPDAAALDAEAPASTQIMNDARFFIV